jgi:DNA repair photolyase
MATAYDVASLRDTYAFHYNSLNRSYDEWVDFAFVDFKNSHVGDELKDLAKDSFRTKLNQLLDARESLIRALINYKKEQEREEEAKILEEDFMKKETKLDAENMGKIEI